MPPTQSLSTLEAEMLSLKTDPSKLPTIFLSQRDFRRKQESQMVTADKTLSFLVFCTTGATAQNWLQSLPTSVKEMALCK